MTNDRSHGGTGREIENLAMSIAERLRKGTGEISEEIADPLERHAWRQAARMAGKLLGQRVYTAETAEGGGIVLVEVLRSKRTPEQLAAEERMIRETRCIFASEEERDRALRGLPGIPSRKRLS